MYIYIYTYVYREREIEREIMNIYIYIYIYTHISVIIIVIRRRGVRGLAVREKRGRRGGDLYRADIFSVITCCTCITSYYDVQCCIMLYYITCMFSYIREFVKWGLAKGGFGLRFETVGSHVSLMR